MSKKLEKLDIGAQELIDALNDETKAEALMKARGWTKKDLLARATLITRDLSRMIHDVNVV